MAWDESDALSAIKTYLAANVDAGMRVHIVRDLDPTTWDNINPPCFCFKDGSQEVSENDSCHIDYTFSGVVASHLKSSSGEAIVGDGTREGVTYYSQLIANLLDYENIISVISLTNSDLLGSKVTNIEPSTKVWIEGSGDWQTKELTAIMRFRIT